MIFRAIINSAWKQLQIGSFSELIKSNQCQIVKAIYGTYYIGSWIQTYKIFDQLEKENNLVESNGFSRLQLMH